MLRNYTLVLMTLLFLAACKKTETTSTSDVEEIGQQAGDIMASVDESGGSGGTLGLLPDSFSHSNSAENPVPMSTHLPNEFKSYFGVPTPQATCGQAGEFSSCSSNVITRTFGGCTIGAATFTGSVTLTWGGGAAACAMSASTQTVTRTPNFTVTGRRSATLTVTKTGTNGQTLTWASGTGTSKVFNFTNDGINRKFAVSGTTLFDFTTSTTAAITVTGTARTSRVMTGGTLSVVNNLTGVSCAISPTNVTWNASTCNCAREGSWSGTCSDGKSYSLTITGCGTGNLTVGSDTTTVSFDRCNGT